jgi:hypothetical protein
MSKNSLDFESVWYNKNICIWSLSLISDTELLKPLEFIGMGVSLLCIISPLAHTWVFASEVTLGGAPDSFRMGLVVGLINFVIRGLELQAPPTSL